MRHTGEHDKVGLSECRHGQTMQAETPHLTVISVGVDIASTVHSLHGRISLLL